MKEKRLDALALALLLFNPIIILLLSKSLVMTIIATAIVLPASYFVGSSRSLRLKVWGFNIAVLLSIFIHSELLFRTFLPERTIPNLYELHWNYYFNKPNLDKEFKTFEYISTYKTNCQGYRMDNLSNSNDTIKRCDWLFIGDSFTQGAQVDYCDLFTTKIYRSFPDKTIINAGISGAGLYDELNYFKDMGKNLHPKVVFLQIGVFNDFFNIKENKATFQDWLMSKSDLYRYFAYNILSTDSLPLGRWTEPFFPTPEENANFNIMYRQSSVQKKKDIEAFRKCIADWKHETDKIGCKLILFLIPSKEQISPSLLKEVQERYDINSSEINLNAPNNLFSTTAKSLGILAFDLTNEFKSSEDFPFFKQDEHMNQTGHQIVAQYLVQNLKRSSSSEPLYMSSANQHERYPTLLRDSTLLYQSQDRNFYMINIKRKDDNNPVCIVKSLEELVHPVYSSDYRYLSYTEGNQENGETDVILMDNVLKRVRKVNPEGSFAAIPAISHDSKYLALPMWRSDYKIANIYLYSITNNHIIKRFVSNKECWRPIFSIDDQKLFYIEKEKFFAIKSIDLKNGKVQSVLSIPFDIWDISISPSGKYLAFAGYKNGNWDLFLYTFSTRKVRQLTNTSGDEWDPSFGLSDTDLWYAGTFGFNDGIYFRKISL